MPAQQGKGKMSFGAVVKAQAEKPIDFGGNFADLPPGITDGVAKFVQVKRGQYKTGDNTGENFVYMRAVAEAKKHTWTKQVFNPKTGKTEAAETVTENIGGRSTSLMIPLCSTKKKSTGEVTPWEENVARMINELEKIFGKNCLEGVDTPEDLDPIFEELSNPDRPPVYIKFTTTKVTPTKEYPDPTPFHYWNGVAEDYVPPDAETYATDAANDNSKAPPPAASPKPVAKTTAPAAKPAPASTAKGPGAKKPQPEPEPEVNPETVDQGDIDSLLARADDGDDDARQTLHDMYIAAGFTEDDYDAAQSWKDLYDGIKAGGPGAASPGDDNWVPVKEDVYKFKYKPIDPKTKKPGTKLVEIEVEVTAVDTKAQTVKIKSLLDPKQTFQVKWDELIRDQ